MHSYDNGTSLPTKLGNWSQLERFFVKKKLSIPKEMIDGTIHCKPGAAELLVQTIYTILTNRVVKTLKDEMEIDFTDRHYQLQLPLHARSTATHSIKNNLKITECMTEPNIITNNQKAHAIIQRHLERKALERVQDPARFNIKPTLGELAQRIRPDENTSHVNKLQPSVKHQHSGHQKTFAKNTERDVATHFKEIKVRQRGKSTPITSWPGSSQTPIVGN